MKIIINGIIVYVVALLAPQILQAQGTTYLSNLGQLSTGSLAVGSDSWLMFYTGTNSSVEYTLNSVQLETADMKSKVAGQFVASIKQQDDHLATGFLGTPFVLFALQKAGHPELAYKLVLNKTYPSWLQQVLWGSTTMWERWDGWRPEKGFQNPGMNSFNHYWLGCVSEWLFTQAAGIDTDGLGFKRIIIHPEIVNPKNGFDWVKASYNSIRGKITSEWKLNHDQFQFNVTIPGNCTATVYVPAKDAANVTEGGKPATQAKGVKFLRMEGNISVFEIGSGQYAFKSW